MTRPMTQQTCLCHLVHSVTNLSLFHPCHDPSVFISPYLRPRFQHTQSDLHLLFMREQTESSLLKALLTATVRSANVLFCWSIYETIPAVTLVCTRLSTLVSLYFSLFPAHLHLARSSTRQTGPLRSVRVLYADSPYARCRSISFSLCSSPDSETSRHVHCHCGANPEMASARHSMGENSERVARSACDWLIRADRLRAPPRLACLGGYGADRAEAERAVASGLSLSAPVPPAAGSLILFLYPRRLAGKAVVALAGLPEPSLRLPCTLASGCDRTDFHRP
ncbi:hypothetical protein BGW36DRAFT_51304 [Talaromyces proteolyticus]|uniref:Uncharacterized protein n=1 Tax=Talaromyces proteolyticus TaxID=1131652 RepID=A0AAD4PTU0_9EURO|nr:uncharacterized protein BGW36DRAFT_51304 [Talaromyces proteolyticus]KAH8691370.1 hypothetical protein BGW36DRAFT_51304 [Talaromyces proteolyticus]